MSPKNKQEGTFKRMKITLELKHEIIEKREQGVSVADLARAYNRCSSTICTILKNKDKIKEVDASKGVTRISAQRLRALDDVEKMLLTWIDEKKERGETINEQIICQKAKSLFAEVIRKMPGSSSADEEMFKGSHGWFEKFKRRTGIYKDEHSNEIADNTGKKEDEIFAADFKKLINTEGYLPPQVFNCDETGLFWKRMPKKTYITEEENELQGHKPMKDRLTVLLCANASGDLKIKPLLIYHSETPRAFKKCNIQKNRLNAMWRSNNKACMTREIFADWLNEVFGPSVKKYLLDMQLSLRALLIMDHAPGHASDIQNDIHEEYNFIKILFLPPNIAPFLQPMTLQVVSVFKKLYTKILFERCFEMTEGTNLSLREFWKDHFHVLTCLKMIDKAWKEVNQKTLILAWNKIWPESVAECDFEGFESVPVEPIIDDIVSLANIMGLKVDKNDIDELVEEHNQDLTNEQLPELSQEEAIEDIIVKKEETEEIQSSESIQEMVQAWETVASLVEKYHPNKAVAIKATNLFNDDAMSHFYQTLKRRKMHK